MGNSCNKPSVNKRKIFTLHKITDKNESKVDEVGNQFELENPSELPNNNFPRRKSSFYHNTNQSNGKVTFNENAARSNATMKRNSFQPPAFQHRLIRETSSVEKRRTSDGNKMINEYEIGCKLGEGSFGKVKMVTRKFLGYEQRYATKIFKKNILKRINEFRKDEDGKMKIDNAFEQVKREIAILKKCNHKNVLKLYEVIDDPAEEKIYLILEYAKGGEIISWDETKSVFKTKQNTEDGFLSEDYIRKIFRDCLKGLQYLHENNIIHRDLKPGNILFDKDNNAKICDFGLAFILNNDDILKSSKGTYHFMAPETFNEKKIEMGISGKSADIWSLGVTLYALVFLVLPFFEKNTVNLINSIRSNCLKFPKNRKISPQLMKLLKLILDKNPKKRITLNQIITNVWVNMNSPNKLETEIFPKQNIHVTEKDIENAVIPIERVVFLKAIAKKLTQTLNSRSSSPSKNFSSKDIFASEIKEKSPLMVALNAQKNYCVTYDQICNTITETEKN